MAVVQDKGIFLNACLEYNNKSGFVVGIDGTCKLITGLHRSAQSVENIIDSQPLSFPRLQEDIVLRHYPAGTSIIGIWIQTSDIVNIHELQSGLNNIYKDNYDVIQVVVTVTISPGLMPTITCYHKNNGVLELTDNNNAMDARNYITKKTITFRMKSVLKLNIFGNWTVDPGILESHVSYHSNLLNQCVLWLPDFNTVINDDNSEDIALSTINNIKGPITIEMLQGPLNGVRPPTINIVPVSSALLMPLTLDIIGIFHTSMGTRTVARLLKKHALYQMKYMIALIKKYKATISIHHYNITTQYTPVTIAYPDQSIEGRVSFSDPALLHERQELHNLFCLPLCQPYLRKLNLHWSHDSKSHDNEYPINPHLELITTNNKDCSVAMVTGSCAYRHYMQDKFNDDGWGCAYRSLQTIWSWYQYQGYTDQSSPSHNDIQQTLVDCGDKEKSFIGSKEWIGSFEVFTVLNHRLNIDSRIQQCPSGAEMSSMGPVLLRHFQTQGTPVMIGGGVLAHTIVGVEYNQNKGETRFLIMDPHYTGKDELKLILGKGCGWKSVSFWDQTASYNMCIPLRPEEI